MSPSPPAYDGSGQPPQTGPGAWLAQLRILALALCFAPLLLLVVTYVALSSGDDVWVYPDAWAPIAIGVLAVAAFLSAETVGFSAAPVPPSMPAAKASAYAVDRFRALLFVRFAMTELVVLAGLVLSFATAGIWPMVIAMVLGWPLIVWEVYPRRRTVERVAEKLGGEGAQTGLTEALGRPDGSLG